MDDPNVNHLFLEKEKEMKTNCDWKGEENELIDL